MATFREGSKTNFRLIMYSHSSTKSENFAKIGPVDVEIICLSGIVKNKEINYKQQQNIACCACVQQPGGLIIVHQSLL